MATIAQQISLSQQHFTSSADFTLSKYPCVHFQKMSISWRNIPHVVWLRKPKHREEMQGWTSLSGNVLHNPSVRHRGEHRENIVVPLADYTGSYVEESFESERMWWRIRTVNKAQRVSILFRSGIVSRDFWSAYRTDKADGYWARISRKEITWNSSVGKECESGQSVGSTRKMW